MSVYVCFFRACWSDPGKITRKNVEKACQVWVYDYILFNPKVCSTCLIDKPARSKHCSICKACVAKADHHCAWINNCVGHYNYRYFIMFLGSTASIALYGTYLVFRILQNEMDVRRVWSLVIYDRETYARTKITSWQAIMVEPLLSALALFAGIAGIVVLVFMLYQLSMVLRGLTTNESFKWDDLKYDIQTHQITTIPKDLYEYNQSHKEESVSSSGSKIRRRVNAKGKSGASSAPLKTFVPSTDDGIEQIPLTSVRQIRNIYNGGAWKNVMDMVFPQRF
ncbi:palmitoyltransferase swf1 [Dinochytrium kinnereticum]|nr:palmitoyltransferase swf1 [Dinochytrium kinnereticum]